jgi:hypothetical protein
MVLSKFEKSKFVVSSGIGIFNQLFEIGNVSKKKSNLKYSYVTKDN